MRASITLHQDSATGPVVAHLSAYATACSWSDNEHGNRDLSVTVPRMLAESFRLYAASGGLWLVASAGGVPSWVGLVDDSSLWSGRDGSGVTVRALGRWSALDDIRYTALWSDSSVAGWEPMTTDNSTAYNPDMWALDTSNRLFIGMTKGTTYAFAADVGAQRYQAPDQGLRTIVAISFDYALLAPAGFDASLNTWTVAGNVWSYAGATPWTLIATGVLQTGTVNATFAATSALNFQIYNFSGAPVTFTGENGTNYLKITNLRVKSTTVASVTADLIVADLAAKIDALNGPTLASATPLTTNPGLDLVDVIYEDAAPTAILEQLETWGNGAGTVYRATVDSDGYLTYQPRGAGGRTWYADVDDIEITASRGDLANSIYAVYKDPSGRTLRTATSTDATSVTRYGRTRQQAVAADTTSATTAGKIRDVALSDRATVPAAAAIAIRRCQAAAGGSADPAEIRPGDTVIVRNLPLLGGGAEIDQVRSFRVGERTYDPIKRETRVTPEARLPRLEVLLGQS